MGVYKVTSKKCLGNQYQKDACNEIKLLEIVKGKFYKIEDDEYAFGVWSGNYNLNYSARKIVENLDEVTFPFELVIDSDDSYFERLIFTSEAEGKYESGKIDALSVLTFKKATPEDLEDYNREYPSDD